MTQAFPVRYSVNGNQCGSNADVVEYGDSLEAVCARLRREHSEDGIAIESLTTEMLPRWEGSEPEPTIILKVTK